MAMPCRPWPRAQVILAQKAALSLTVSPSDQVDSMAVALRDVCEPLAVLVARLLPARL
jgi:hypothetical protein